MIDRMLLALGTMLVWTGLTLAQTTPTVPTDLPAAVPPVPPPAPPLQPVAVSSGWAYGGVDGTTKERWWINGEYVLALFQGDNIPALVTTSPVGTPQASAGLLGFASTTTLIGDQTVNDTGRSGFRVGGGVWLDPERWLALDSSFLFIQSQSTPFSASSPGTPILARPFVNVNTKKQDSALIAFPGAFSGAINVSDNSGSYEDIHLDLSEVFAEGDGIRVAFLFGYRYYRYDEKLGIHQTVSPLGAAFTPGTTIVSEDDFNTQNGFNGGDLGVRTELDFGRLSVDLLGKIAVGSLRRQVDIIGAQTTSVPGTAPVTVPGGVYALSTNIGEHTQTDWTALPEIGVDLNWQITSNLRAKVGYSMLFLEDIARAADQINFAINPNFFPPVTGKPAGAAQPAFDLQRSNMWIQTLNVGMEFVF